MICRKCRKNQASLFISSARFDESNRIGFCDTCAEEAGILSMLTKVESLLHGFGYSGPVIETEEGEIPVEFAEECSVCGLDLRTFEREFTIGCDHCCNIFGSLIFNFVSLLSPEPLDKRLTPLHAGQQPAAYELRRKAAELRSQINRELKTEDYKNAQKKQVLLAKMEQSIADKKPSAEHIKPAKYSAVQIAKAKKYLREYNGIPSSSSSAWLQTRIEIRRNIADIVFPHMMDDAKLRLVRDFATGLLGDGYEHVDFDVFDPLDRINVESRHFGRKLSSASTIAFKRGAGRFLIVNDQDHLIFTYNGLEDTAEAAMKKARAELLVFERKADLAYSKRFGYITSSPRNMGAGIGVSVLMHLPFSLAQGVTELYPARADRAGVRFEPYCGRGIEHHGFFKVTNGVPFNTDEQKEVARVLEFAHYLEQEEKRVRAAITEPEEKHLRRLMVKVVRNSTLSWRLSYQDVLRLFSFLAIGAQLGEPGLEWLSPAAVIPSLTSPCIMSQDRRIYTVNECEKRRADLFADIVEHCKNPLLAASKKKQKAVSKTPETTTT